MVYIVYGTKNHSREHWKFPLGSWRAFWAATRYPYYIIKADNATNELCSLKSDQTPRQCFKEEYLLNNWKKTQFSRLLLWTLFLRYQTLQSPKSYAEILRRKKLWKSDCNRGAAACSLRPTLKPMKKASFLIGSKYKITENVQK